MADDFAARRRSARRGKRAFLMALAVALLAVTFLAVRMRGTLLPLARDGRRPESTGRRAAQDDAHPRAPLPRPLPSPGIVVLKSQRELRLYSGDEPVRTYRIGLGFAPEGDKEREGDGRTPEGDFYVCSKNPNSSFYLALGLSYPDEEDARRGLQGGLITQAQHDEIVRAIRRGQEPPWNTALGGEIFIHGRGSDRDWTLGCIALDDENVGELYDAVPLRTPVAVRP